MKNRWNENKTWIICTALATLLPVMIGLLLWNQLPDTMATHFAADNTPNGWSSKWFAVFGLPFFCLGAHILCTAGTLADPKSQGISNKVLRIILLICPAASTVSGSAIYAYALSWNIRIDLLAQVFLGVLFVVIGNYLPKCRRNYTVGIKLPWTMDDDENWNRTHRLAGVLWIICGLFFIIQGIFGTFHIWIAVSVLGIMALVPCGYSFWFAMRKTDHT